VEEATTSTQDVTVFFGAGLKRRLEQGGGDSGHGSVAFGGVVLGAAAFALVGTLEAAMTNAAHEGEQQAVYTVNVAGSLSAGATVVLFDN
jgi:hypothetical protein